MNQAEEAVTLFSQGCSCSQAVLAAHSRQLGFDPQVAMQISSGFGGGMCRGKTCGAVTGAIMVLGLRYCVSNYNSREGRAEVTKAVHRFTTAFKDLHSTTNCELLMGMNVNTPEGRQAALDANLFVTKCRRFVEDTCRILAEMEAAT